MRTQQRWVLHADMDAFYASVEQRDRPELQGKPVIIGARGPRGVVSAASYEARKFGVRSAMPGFQAHKLCPHGVFLDGDMRKYAAVSKQVRRIFEEFSDQIEPLALDEAFIDITGSLGLFGTPEQLGQKLKQRVRDEVQLAVSIGIASNKLLAKMACTASKPDGLFVLLPQDVPAFLEKKPVRALFGIGPKAEEQLAKLGINTLSQLAQADVEFLSAVFLDHAQEMRDRANGKDDRPVQSHREPKSIGEEATFEHNVTDEQLIISAIISHAEIVAARARRSSFRGTTVTLKVKLARRKKWGEKAVANHELFPVLTRQVRLSQATGDGQLISQAAISLYKKLNLTEGIRLIGVSLSGLQQEEAPRQLDLFGAVNAASVPKITKNSAVKSSDAPPQTRAIRSRGEQLGATMDQISARFGSAAIVRGSKAMRKITASDKIKLGDLDHDETE